MAAFADYENHDAAGLVAGNAYGRDCDATDLAGNAGLCRVGERNALMPVLSMVAAKFRGTGTRHGK